MMNSAASKTLQNLSALGLKIICHIFPSMKVFYILLLTSLLAACHHSSSDESPAPITPETTVTTLAGDGTSGLVDGAGPSARFYFTWGATLDAQGNVYVADHGNGRIRRVTPSGQVSTFADFGTPYNVTEGPMGVVMGSNGTLYVSFEGIRPLQRVSAAGVVSDMPGAAAGTSFSYARSLVVDAQGNVYVAELLGSKIDKIDPAGNVTVLAGSATKGSVDGQGAQAQFEGPSGITVDRQGVVYVADAPHIRRITPTGQVSTLAGSANYGHADGTGSAAGFEEMYGITSDAKGILYVADGSSVRRVTPAGEVTTFAGSTKNGHLDGKASSALFGVPAGIVGDPTTGLYVCDGSYVRKVLTK